MSAPATPGAARLRGIGVVLTRPRGQSEPVAAALAAAGAQALVFPTLEIVATPLDAASQAGLDALPGAALAIFVSANAVEHGLAAARTRGPWPADVAVATVGLATAAQLRREGFDTVVAPTGRFDSDALLALLPAGSLQGRRVVIFRGVGGREHLRQALAAQGATVHYVECYRRVRPTADARAVRAAVLAGRVQAVQAMSAESLENLVAIAGDDLPWSQVALMVPHPAIARHPAAMAFACAMVVEPGTHALEAALAQLHTAACA